MKVKVHVSIEHDGVDEPLPLVTEVACLDETQQCCILTQCRGAVILRERYSLGYNSDMQAPSRDTWPLCRLSECRCSRRAVPSNIVGVRDDQESRHAQHT